MKLKFEHKLPLLYFIIGACWIFFSDYVASLVASDIKTYNVISTYKGWFYVLITAILLYFLAKRHSERYRKINDELRKAKEKAEESDNLKTRFLENISHEIRTPMNAIMGFTDLMKRDTLDDIKRKVYSDMVYINARNLMSLISNILEISKYQEGHQKVFYTEVNLDLLMDKIHKEHELYIMHLPSKRLRLILEKQCDSDFRFNTDSMKLEMILNNLLNNSIKFTLEGDIIFGYRIREKKIEFYVNDTGKGINSEDMQIIFERFRTTKKEDFVLQGGAGLGLAVAKIFVEIMGGRITVQSNSGKGSSFIFSLPFLNGFKSPATH